jgi:two-component system heavy metal sensor histidine kinase CusS
VVWAIESGQPHETAATPPSDRVALLVSGLVLTAFGTAALFAIQRQKLEAVDTEIRSLGARHPGWILNRGNYERFDAALEFIFGEEHRNQIILLVKDAAGQTLYTSSRWPKKLDPARLDCSLDDDPQAIAAAATNRVGSGFGLGRGRGGMGRGLGPGGGGGLAPAAFTKIPRFLTVSVNGSKWRLGLLGTSETTLVIGLNFDTAQAELDRTRNAFLLALPLALFLVGGGGWWVAGRALRPLKRITETAEGVTARGLDQRIPASKEAPEIARLIQVLNGMMDRLEASFRQATRFSADASHELKTPLAAMQGELENALQTAAPGSREQQVLTSLLEETHRLKTITRGLLLLAQADAGQLQLTLEDVQLSSELGALIEDARILASESNLTFELQTKPAVCVQGDRGLLNSALLNLIQNAIKYNEPGGRIAVKLTSDSHRVIFEIGNSGHGIPEAEQSRVFDRFYRGDAARADKAAGLGIGLSLAREIARAHGGDLVLGESTSDWTSFRMTLKSCTHR